MIPFVNALPTNPVEPPLATTGIFSRDANFIILEICDACLGKTTTLGFF